MRYAVSISVGTLLWMTLIAFWLHATGSFADGSSVDEPSLISKQRDETNQQIDNNMIKRDWNRNLHSWGKRAWQNLQTGWGKRDAWPNQMYPFQAEKRAWSNLQGAWGKRYDPEDEYAIKQLAALIEQEEQQDPRYSEYGSENDLGFNDDEKRAWNSLNGGGWGKRADKWDNFRGSWGKRDPAWTNLKGIWGKRSYVDRGAQ